MEKRATKEENSREKEENPKTNVKIQPGQGPLNV